MFTNNKQARADASHACDACGGRGFPFGITSDGDFEYCPVCLGAGRISDRMPVADAVADAETLLRVSEEGYYSELFQAPRYGDWSIRALSHHPSAFAPVEEYARRAAHAAFRAVPGLRME